MPRRSDGPSRQRQALPPNCATNASKDNSSTARFLGELTPEQSAAAAALLEHETGVLAAATAFGKTVVAAKMIAARERNTLVLVHRRQLLEQWVARLQAFLDIPPGGLGVIHGGKKKPTGIIDVALMQSLVRRGVVSDLVADYGHVVVDECHHLSAVGFEAIARAAKARYVLGLSATVTRKDGHHPIIFMQCGPVRYRVDARKQAASRPFDHKVVFRRTEFRLPRRQPDEQPAIQELYAKLAQDPARNDLIFDDILSALEDGRSPVVITERKDHLDMLAGRLSKFAKNVIVLRGGMGARRSRAASAALEEISDTEERVLVATGRYLGEGFDDARLDTLFLTMPISWRGTLSQYAGRLHRRHASKRDVVIYDYVDENEPMLMKMAAQARGGISKPRVSACPQRRTCSGTSHHASGHSRGPAAPLIVQNSTPFNVQNDTVAPCPCVITSRMITSLIIRDIKCLSRCSSIEVLTPLLIVYGSACLWVGVLPRHANGRLRIEIDHSGRSRACRVMRPKTRPCASRFGEVVRDAASLRAILRCTAVLFRSRAPVMLQEHPDRLFDDVLGRHGHAFATRHPGP